MDEDSLLDPGYYTGSTADRMLSIYVIKYTCNSIGTRNFCQNYCCWDSLTKSVTCICKKAYYWVVNSIYWSGINVYIFISINICIYSFVPNHQKYTCLSHLLWKDPQTNILIIVMSIYTKNYNGQSFLYT